MKLLKRPVVVAVALSTALAAGAATLPSPAASHPPVDPGRSSVAKQPSRLVVKTGTYPGPTYDFVVTGTLYRDGRRYGRSRVALQAKVAGHWKRIDVDRTNGSGVVKWYFKPSVLRWRLKFSGDEGTRDTRSAVFRFGSGRATTSSADVVDPSSVVSGAP